MLRSLLRVFGGSKSDTSRPSRHGFVKQGNIAEDYAFRSNKYSETSAQYSLTDFEQSPDDGRSDRSTEMLRDPDAIRRTTDTNVKV